jgi:Ni,Fe-hydrogenase I cytochrome b subunit
MMKAGHWIYRHGAIVRVTHWINVLCLTILLMSGLQNLKCPSGAQLTYLVVIFFLLPLIVLAGLAMSPGLDAGLWLTDLFGGRQGARTVHFIAAVGIVLFVLVHVAMVILSGLFNNIRSMITGHYNLGEED